MENESTKGRLRDAGITAWRGALLATAATLILILYIGMVWLVARGQMEDGPLILFTGVIVGYLLHLVRASQ